MKTQIIQRGGVMLAAMTACLAGASSTANAVPDAPVGHSRAAEVQAAGLSYSYWYRPKHVKSIGGKCGKKVIAEASGRGPMTLRIDETRSLSSTFSKSLSINYKALTAAVGWDVTKSRSITVSGSKEVPRGKYGVLKAYTRYSGKMFDVYNVYNPYKHKLVAKNKKAYKPIGVCYKFTKS
ncbi:hypothetical protein ACFWY6_34595 [Streptomyces sp. NPDC059037]|uniref:hypothetical protein n=1 Tax=Streptomyces sp. NPDC059037 TaxID=3346710 RepID=UPI0036BC115A